MAKINLKNGGALLAPVPAVMVSCGSPEKPNIVTVAWTGIINTHPPKTYISLRPERHSYKLIEQGKEFVINLTTCDMAFATDLCGVKSGKDIDKFKATRLTAAPSFAVKCPSIEQSPLSIECRITDIMPLGSHTMFLADIVSVSADERFIDEKGRLMLDRCNLMAYSHGEYFALGKKLGRFGFSVRKKFPRKKD